MAAELDAQYVKELLDEPAPAEPAAPVEGLDADFDLSLDDLEAASPAVVASEPEVELEEFPLDDDLSFGSVLEQQTAAQESLDDLGDFDLDLGADLPASTQSDDDFLLSLEDDLKDLPAGDVPTVTESTLDDLDLSADFDLSLADEMDAAAEPKDAFASELDDVNAELDRLEPIAAKGPSLRPREERYAWPLGLALLQALGAEITPSQPLPLAA